MTSAAASAPEHQLLERVHLGAAIIMAFGASASNAVEGIGFAVATAVCLLRLKALWPEFRLLAHQPVVWVFTGLLTMFWIARLWGTVGTSGFWLEFERLMVLPWLLWPLRHHSRALLAALVSGALVSILLLTITNCTADGIRVGNVVTRGKDLDMLGVAYASSFVITASVPDRIMHLGLWLRVVVMAVLVWGMYLLGQRTPQVVAVISAIFVIAVSPVRPEWRRWSAAMIILTMLVVAFIARPPSKLSTSLALARSAGDRALSDAELAQMTSHRYQLAAAALEIWRDHPWFGSGTGSFKEELTRIVTDDPASIALPKERAATFAQLTTAHNGFLDELACRGVVGLGLLVACLALIARTALRPPGNLVLAASLLAWCLFSFANATTQRGTFQIMLAAMVTCAAAIGSGSDALRPRSPLNPTPAS